MAKYVPYSSRCKCTCGTMENYLSTDKGHGALFGGNPLMNANDHVVGTNITHFGECAILTAKANGFPTKCKPLLPTPWINVNKSYLIEGAPALTMDSLLTCYHFGVISITSLLPAPEDSEIEDDASTEDNSDIENIITMFPNWNEKLADAINSCAVGVSQTVSDSIVIQLPDGSSLIYEISTEVNSSSVSIADINMNLVKQLTTLNCSGLSLTENGMGLSAPLIAANIGNTNVKTSLGLEADFVTGCLVMNVTQSTTTSCENYSVGSAVTIKKPFDIEPPPVPEPVVIPVEVPEPTPWYETTWNWACSTAGEAWDGATAVGTFIVEHPVEIFGAVGMTALTAVIWTGAVIEPTIGGECAAVAWSAKYADYIAKLVPAF